MKRLLLLLLMVPLLLFSQDDSFTDERDGKTYKTVKIGEQVWMAENLAYKPDSGNFWINSVSLSYRTYTWIYNKDSSNLAKLGYIYDWKTAKKVCPAGWHLPSDKEWTVLIDYLGGKGEAGNKMKSTSSWEDDGNGTNESGLNGLPSGVYMPGEGFSNGIGYYSLWWSSSIDIKYDSYAWCFGCDLNKAAFRKVQSKSLGISVRCIKD